MNLSKLQAGRDILEKLLGPGSENLAQGIATDAARGGEKSQIYAFRQGLAFQMVKNIRDGSLGGTDMNKDVAPGNEGYGENPHRSPLHVVECSAFSWYYS